MHPAIVRLAAFLPALFISACVTVNVDDDADSAPPEAPAALWADAEDSLVLLRWDASANAEAYVLSRAEKRGGPYVELYSSPITFYADTAVTNGTQYYYVVQALNAAGTSAYSTEVTATPSGTTEPTTPACLNSQNECEGQTVPNGDNCEYIGPSSSLVAMTVYDYQTSKPSAGATVRVIDNTSGLPTGICAVADSFGQFNMKVPTNSLLGFSVEKVAAVTSYTYHKTYSSATVDFLYSMSSITYQLIYGIIGVTPSAGTSMVTGLVTNSYGNETTDTAVLRVFTAGAEAYYFDDAGLPADWTGQPSLNPGNALFAGLNVAAGSKTVTLTYNGAATTTSGGGTVVFPDSAVFVTLRCDACR